MSVVGIDLGTTKSVIGIWRNGPQVIPVAGKRAMPSSILAVGREIVVGERALNHPSRYSAKGYSISSVKRLMGTAGETEWGSLKTYPQEVSAFILSELRYQASRYIGGDVSQAVIAVPAHYNENQRRATQEAAEIAGLEVRRLLNEATAAVLTFAYARPGFTGKVLVVDMGGGTLDISLAEIGNGCVEVLSVAGDDRLGGDDVDQIIIDYVLGQAMGVPWEDLSGIEKSMLRESVTAAKLALSTVMRTSIYLPSFVSGRDLDVNIDRDTLETQCLGLLERVKKHLRKVYSDAGLKPDNTDACLLIGGASRMPMIQRVVSQEAGHNLFAGVDPETAVAEGAIIQAGILEGSMKDRVLLDVLPSTYGVAVGDHMEPVVARGATIPARRSKLFTTSKDSQSAVTIMLYQGEHQYAAGNTYLGTLDVVGIPPAKAGIPKIEVTFDADVNTIIHVTAKDLGSGKAYETTVRGPFGLNDAQLKAMQKRLTSWAEERASADLRDEARCVQFELARITAEDADALDWNTLRDLRQTLKELETSLSTPPPLAGLVQLIHKAGLCRNTATKMISDRRQVVEDARAAISHYRRILPHIQGQPEARPLVQGTELAENYIEERAETSELSCLVDGLSTLYRTLRPKAISCLFDSVRRSDAAKAWLSAANAPEIRRSMDCLATDKEVNLLLQLVDEGSEVAERGPDPSTPLTGSPEDAALLAALAIWIGSDRLSAFHQGAESRFRSSLYATVLCAMEHGNKADMRERSSQAIGWFVRVRDCPREIAHLYLHEEEGPVKANLLSHLLLLAPETLTEIVEKMNEAEREVLLSSRRLRLNLTDESGNSLRKDLL